MKMVFLFDFKIDKFPLIGKGKMLTTTGYGLDLWSA